MEEWNDTPCYQCDNEIGYALGRFELCLCGTQICMGCWYNITEEAEHPTRGICPGCGEQYSRTTFASDHERRTYHRLFSPRWDFQQDMLKDFDDHPIIAIRGVHALCDASEKGLVRGLNAAHTLWWMRYKNGNFESSRYKNKCVDLARTYANQLWRIYSKGWVHYF